MAFHRQKNHIIDFLFPVVLFFVFAVSALTVLLLSANIYSSATGHSSMNYTAGTALSYLTEKVHQNDVNGNISIGTLDGNECLILKQEYNGTTYYTYIYTDNDTLKELFIKEGTDFSPDAGRAILPVNSFTMKSVSQNSFQFTCEDQDGQDASVIVSIKSTK
jgi:hypothetical protein